MTATKAPAARLNLSLLGPFEARMAGVSLALPKKTQALLSYVALSTRPVTRTQLATLLWGETGRAQAQQSLRQTLSGLRQALGPDASAIVEADAGTVALDSGLLTVDALAFEALVKKGALAEAVPLYRGEFLAGLDLDEMAFEDWLLSQRERMRELAMAALAQLLGQQRTAGRLEDAVQTASRLLGLDPLHEPAHRALMELYIAQGRRPAALRQYQGCVNVLRRELGVEPAAETQKVYADILRGQAKAAAPRPHGDDRERIAADATPLVGRDAELEVVRKALARTQDGRGAALIVSGEAGLGKTRLVRQIGTEASQGGARVLVGRAYRAEQILPLGPWRDALRDGHLVDDPEEVLQAADPAKLFAMVAGLLSSVSGLQPLVVVLEDLQWADDMTLRLFAYLVRRISGRAILFVATVRTEELIDAPSVREFLDDLERDATVARIELQPLSRDGIGALVSSSGRRRSAGDARGLAEQIWMASEGNPFMAVEILRALEEGGVSSDAGSLPLPERVRIVVAGRLARLSELARQLLGAAAVVGRASDFSLLREVAQLDDEAAATAVEELVRRRIFRAVGDRFEFTHERIREIAYAELLAPRRKLLHRQAAHAIRSLYLPLEPHYAVIAAHAFEAGLWSDAADYFRRAGEWNMVRSFNREAAAAFARAVAALDRAASAEEKALAIDVRLQLRNALIMSGDIARGGAPLAEAQRLAAATGDPVRNGRVAAHLSSERWWQGRPDEALAAADEVTRLADATGDPALRQAAIEGRGYAYHGMGNYRLAHETLEPLFTMQDAVYGKGVLPVVSPLHQAIAGLAHCGEFERARERAQEAVARAEQLEHRYMLMHACWTAAEVNAHRGEVEEGLRYVERALGLILERSDFFIAANMVGCQGYLLALGGNPKDGIGRMRDALGNDPPQWRIGVSRLVARLAEAFLLAGHFEEARSAVARCLELTRGHGERGYEAWALRLRGELALATNNPSPQRAQDDFSRALVLAGDLGMQPTVAHCHAGIAKALIRDGNSKDAAAHADAARGLYLRMGMTRWL